MLQNSTVVLFLAGVYVRRCCHCQAIQRNAFAWRKRGACGLVGVCARFAKRAADQAWRFWTRRSALAAQIGLEGLSIGAVAEATHMSKSGVFAHFGSREELQISVIREYYTPLRADEVFYPAMQGAARAAARAGACLPTG
jgi:hypothetical protein